MEPADLRWVAALGIPHPMAALLRFDAADHLRISGCEQRSSPWFGVFFGYTLASQSVETPEAS